MTSQEAAEKEGALQTIKECYEDIARWEHLIENTRNLAQSLIARYGLVEHHPRPTSFDDLVDNQYIEDGRGKISS